MAADEQNQHKKLTFKEQGFVDAYVGVARGNGTKAAVMAGYSQKTAAEIAYENLRKPHIQAAISKRVSEYAMSPEEVLAAYADIARNASIVPLLELALRNQHGKAVSRPYIELLDEDGNIKPEARFIKSMKLTTNTKAEEDTVAVELHDPMAALDRLAKYHGLAVNRTEITGKDGGAVEISGGVTLYLPDNGRDVGKDSGTNG